MKNVQHVVVVILVITLLLLASIAPYGQPGIGLSIDPTPTATGSP